MTKQKFEDITKQDIDTMTKQDIEDIITGLRKMIMVNENFTSSLQNMIKREAYKARILEELHFLNYDVAMMKFHRDMAMGKACGAIEVYQMVTKDYEAGNELYEYAIETATRDIDMAKKLHECEGYYNNKFVRLLNHAGFDGEAHYASNQAFNKQIEAQYREYYAMEGVS